ncbi:MAG TPA: type VII secretion target [Pseudonocardiaceae bacterium]|nr:type VII secretion target [Pseudonocardiaceae bacterium]
MGQYIKIAPAAVSETASDFQSISEEASGTATHCADESITAATTNAGWASSAALADCAQQWEAKINSMVTSIGQVSEKLAANAADYTRADAECAQTFSQILGEFADNSWSAG